MAYRRDVVTVYSVVSLHIYIFLQRKTNDGSTHTHQTAFRLTRIVRIVLLQYQRLQYAVSRSSFVIDNKQMKLRRTWLECQRQITSNTAE